MKHELLAPAGSPETLEAVITAGADAVYLGGNLYGARAYAQNFTEEQILQALNYAHLRGKKIFLTVNTLLKNRENGQALYDYLLPFYRNGLDAIIVQDFGVLDFVREHFPDLPVHASTQMSVANVYGADYLKQQGVKRIIPARELSLKEIHAIYEATQIELECFIHGALCFCYSGQCLMSSLLGGRSGNRGRCAQPCRFPYQVVDQSGKKLSPQDRFPLSLKDLCTLSLLPDICEAGVYSFKIEGRMKSAAYAAGVTEIYRKYLDLYEKDPHHYQVSPADSDRLLDLGNRNGFTEGYYKQRNGRSMVTLTKSFHTGVAVGEQGTLSSAQCQQILPLAGKIWMRIGESMRLTLRVDASKISEGIGVRESRRVSDGTRVGAGAQVCVSGEKVQEAQKRPLSEDDVRKKIEKCGNTSFYFTSLEVDMEGKCFVPVGQLNDLRRKGLEEMQALLLADQRRVSGFIPVEKKETETPVMQKFVERKHPYLDVIVSDCEQLEETLKNPCVDRISLDLAASALPGMYADLLQESLRKIQKAGKASGFCFPPVFRARTSAYYLETGLADVLKRFDCVWVKSYDSLEFALQQLKLPYKKVYLDNGLYVFSEETCQAFAKQHLSRYTVSFELNQGELKHMPNAGAEMTIYGRTPMMVTAQCILKNAEGCKQSSQEMESRAGVDKARVDCTKGKKEKDFPDSYVRQIYLKDRKAKSLLVRQDCLDCLNVIYNSEPLYLLHQVQTICDLQFGSLRISFVTETPKQVRKILGDYRLAFWEGKELEMPKGKESFTTGHFKKGVE